MGNRSYVVWLFLCCSLLWLNVAGCSHPRSKGGGTGETGPVVTIPPSEKTKVVVLRLENSTKRGKTDKSTTEDRLFGNGIRAQIVDALEQSGRFTVVNNAGSRQVLQREVLTDSGEIKGSVRERLGSLGDAGFLIAGAMMTYQLSKESKNAGIEADLLFRESQAKTVSVDGILDIARKAFENLKPVGQDRLVLELWLFDAKTGRRLATTKIEGTPSDSSEVLATPMQQAVRGGAIKAVNWIADTGAAFRAGTLVVPPLTVEMKKTPNLGAEAGRGSKTLPNTPQAPRVKVQTLPKDSRTEKIVPAAPPPEGDWDDSGNVADKPPTGTGKVPPQEEWGEK